MISGFEQCTGNSSRRQNVVMGNRTNLISALSEEILVPLLIGFWLTVVAPVLQYVKVAALLKH
jgi:hypothetical protein